LEERDRWRRLAAELLVPVTTQNTLVGLLAVGQKRSGVEYGTDDETVLMALCNQTAVAVENARLYATVQQQLAAQRRAEERLLDSLHEKEVLLKEIHHRVKNNLQVIYSLLSLQAQYAHDLGTLEVLRDSQNRIRSMALIHEKLYQSANLADIDFGEYLRTLSSQLHRSYATSDRVVRLVVNTAPIRLPLNTALPCALIASELISNAFKHAFAGRAEGVLHVRVCGQPDGRVELEVADNGVGMPVVVPGEARIPATLGMQLVSGLVKQLDGSLEVTNGAGARFLVSFPTGS
jgi:two-component sensor histidine kinase